MDFFKFISAADPTNLDQGEAINGIKRSMWIERYSVPGEFEFQAPLSSGLREFLPTGTLISHADTLEIMIVENHQIKEKQNEDPLIIVTGRSFPSYLENRIVGTNGARTDETIVPYTVTADYIWNQIVKIINDHIKDTVDADDALVGVLSSTSVPGTGISAERIIDFGTVWERVFELLRAEDLGIKTIRKNTFGIGTPGSTVISIYRGVDRSASVSFSWKSGDLSAAEYLFTNKNNKNAALVVGQYIYLIIDGAPSKYDRRMMIVDGSDIDGWLGAPPVDAVLTGVMNALATRGVQTLMAQKDITLSQTDISRTTHHQYRRDFNVGDLISLDGNFGQIAVMRIVEFAEIEDENGESGHPTLALPGA